MVSKVILPVRSGRILQEQRTFHMRVILYTGKGGVGKTSVAAATALRSAELGYKTIIISTDAAHSLSDSVDIPLGAEATPIAPNLWGQETDINFTIEKYWGTIGDWLRALMAWRGMDEVLAEEMAVLPGMEELANLLYIINYYDNKEHDVIVVDCAPTGETLRLLSFPEVMHWWMQKMFPLERRAANIVRPILRPLLDIPFPDDKVFDSVQNLFKQLDRMRELLTNPDISSVRLVMNPEKMVIKEAQRTYTYLNLYGYFTDLVVCNRVIRDDVDGHYFDTWKKNQAGYLQMIDDAFNPIPSLKVPLFDREVVGLPMLKRVADALFEDKDPTKVFFHGQTHDIQKVKGRYVLSVPLPFASKEQIGLTRSDSELVVQVGSYRRNFLLPRKLAATPVKEARFEEDVLKISFEEEKRKK